MKFECPFCRCHCESETDIFNEIVQCPKCGKDFIPQIYRQEQPKQKISASINTTVDATNHKQTLTRKISSQKNSSSNEFKLPKICKALHVLELISLIIGGFYLVVPTGFGIYTRDIEAIAIGLFVFASLFLFFLTILSVSTIIKLLAQIEFNTRRKN